MKAQLAIDHPEFVATRGGERLGYVCFGNPAVQEWAFNVLSKLIVEWQADWIKLDFNLDPGAGCNRADHGHGAARRLAGRRRRDCGAEPDLEVRSQISDIRSRISDV